MRRSRGKMTYYKPSLDDNFVCFPIFTSMHGVLDHASSVIQERINALTGIITLGVFLLGRWRKFRQNQRFKTL